MKGGEEELCDLLVVVITAFRQDAEVGAVPNDDQLFIGMREALENPLGVADVDEAVGVAVGNERWNRDFFRSQLGTNAEDVHPGRLPHHRVKGGMHPDCGPQDTAAFPSH